MTPRTDAFIEQREKPSDSTDAVFNQIQSDDFARQLETELSASTAALATIAEFAEAEGSPFALNVAKTALAALAASNPNHP